MELRRQTPIQFAGTLVSRPEKKKRQGTEGTNHTVGIWQMLEKPAAAVLLLLLKYNSCDFLIYTIPGILLAWTWATCNVLLVSVEILRVTDEVRMNP